VGIAALDNLKGIADGVVPGGACGCRRRIRSLRAVSDRDLSRRHVDQYRNDEERRDPSRPFAEKLRVFAFDAPEVADAAADVSADPFGVLMGDFQAAVGERFIRRGDRVMCETPRPSRSHRLYRTCPAEQYWKSFSCAVRPLLKKPAGHSIRACRWSLDSPRSPECADPLSPLSMSARTNARRLLWRYKRYSPRIPYWPQ